MYAMPLEAIGVDAGLHGYQYPIHVLAVYLPNTKSLSYFRPVVTIALTPYFFYMSAHFKKMQFK